MTAITPTTYDVFLSHSSADKPAVKAIAHKLQNAEIFPFLDVWHLVPGEPWQEALEEALDKSRTCAVFLGPGGVHPWQNEEMRTALNRRTRDKAHRVIPVLLPGSREPQEPEVPAFLSRLAWVDFRAGLDDEDAFRQLVNGIKGIFPGPGNKEQEKKTVHQLDASNSYRCMALPPEDFVHRNEYEKLFEVLCPAVVARSGMSIGITVTLRGAGGFGKTALAQAICQDQKVRQTYPDGVLWTTMGEDIDENGRLARVRDLIRWWTKEKESPTYETVAAAGARLRDLLFERKVLIVIDDVWSSADLSFAIGIGRGSALLITTRDSQLQPPNSLRVEVGSMDYPEAVSLLRSGLQAEPVESFYSLAARLGGWPLLLRLVNRQLSEMVNGERLSVSEAVKESERALQAEGLVAFDRDDPIDRHAAADRAISASIRRLPDADQERYLKLSIFPDDVDVPVSVLGKFWSLGYFEAQKVSRRLHDLSLLARFDRRNGAVRVHDVVRQVLIAKSGNNIPFLHEQLLQTFLPLNGCWSDLSSDSFYMWNFLAYHLVGAGRAEELKSLLFDFGFIKAKIDAVGVDSLIADYGYFSADNSALRTVQDAIRLSAHALHNGSSQLASQLLGRLLGQEDLGIQKLVQGGKSWRGGYWFRPRNASLTHPGGALIRLFEGHQDVVTALATVGEKRIVSASRDRTLRVWDLDTGHTIHILDRHTDWVTAVSPVGSSQAVSSSYDGTIHLWDINAGQSVRSFKGHIHWITAVATVDNERFISTSVDRTLQVWDIKSGEVVHVLKGHLAKVTAVAVISGRRAISASADETLRIWDIHDGKTIGIFRGHSAAVNAIAVIDGRHAISASEDGAILLWDFEAVRAVRVLRGHASGVNSLAVIDGRRVVSASSDQTLRVWDCDSGRTIRVLEGHTDRVSAVALIDSRRAISASADRTLRLWDLEIEGAVLPQEGHSDSVNSVATIDDRHAVSASADTTLRVWDLESMKTVSILRGHEGSVNGVVALGGGLVVSASADRSIRVWEWSSGRSLQIINEYAGAFNSIAALSEELVISSSEEDLTVREWSLRAGEGLRIIKRTSPGIISLSVVGDGRVVSVLSDGRVQVWSLQTGQTLFNFEGQLGRIQAAIALDASRAVSASTDGVLQIWDLNTGQAIRSLKSHTHQVASVAVVDSQRLISTSVDRTIRLWDLDSGRSLAILTLDAPAWRIAVTPDGKMIVAGEQSGRMHFFDLVLPGKDR